VGDRSERVDRPTWAIENERIDRPAVDRKTNASIGQRSIETGKSRSTGCVDRTETHRPLGAGFG
jgi:hypothetical protein